MNCATDQGDKQLPSINMAQIKPSSHDAFVQVVGLRHGSG